MTGLWDAKVDRAPVLALTGQVDIQVLGPGAFQEVDLPAAFAPVAAWSQTVLPESHHAELMALACKHALLRRDVAHLVFPDDVQTLPAPDAPVALPVGRVGPSEIGPPAESLAAALDLLARATRPVFIVGHGARDHMEPIVALAERLGAPIVTTFKAKGAVPDDHPLAAGVLGRSGTPVASWLMNEADLLVVLGASFANHTGIYQGHPIIQVDLDPLQLGKFHPVTVPMWARRRRRRPGAGRRARRHGGDRPARRRRGPPGAVGRREGQPRRRRPWARHQQRGGLRRPHAPGAPGRRDRRRRGQPRLFVRALLRMLPSGDPDVRLPGLDRLRLPRRDGRLGGHRRVAQDLRGHRRRRLRAVHGRAAHGGQARHGHHARAAQQRPAGQDLERSSARGSGTSGRRRCTTPTSRGTPSCAARSASASPPPTSSTTHWSAASPTTAPRWSRS